MVRPPTVTEVKRHLDGRVERFATRLVLWRPGLAVLRFDHTRARRAGGISIPGGSRSYGFFWARRPYVLYRIEGPEGRLLAHRFDAVEEVSIGEREVGYTDLLLDVWAAGGRVWVEDEDEVGAARRAGRLSAVQRRRIAGAKAVLLRGHARIGREAARLLREAGVDVR